MLSTLPELETSVCLLEPAGDKEEEMELMLGSLSGTSASTEFQPSDAVINGCQTTLRATPARQAWPGTILYSRGWSHQAPNPSR